MEARKCQSACLTIVILAMFSYFVKTWPNRASFAVDQLSLEKERSPKCKHLKTTYIQPFHQWINFQALDIPGSTTMTVLQTCQNNY